MGERIDHQNYGCIEDFVPSRPLQVLTLRLPAREPEPLTLAQPIQALPGPGAYGSSAS